jgi:outer membrane protein OmpA-like peptidoglycan-associated protein
MDPRGADPPNQALSGRRVSVVRDALIQTELLQEETR